MSGNIYKMDKVLITGASGLIGTRLTALLLERGYSIHHLSRERRNDKPDDEVRHFVWDIEKGEIDKVAFDDIKTIIHLAGAGVADKRWTSARKQEIIDSRVKSGELLYSFLKNEPHTVKTFITAGAVGYYGDCGYEIITEDHKPGTDFLASVCKKWELPAQNIGQLGIREVRCRIGLVLDTKGGALPELIKTLPFGFATYFSKDPLYYPWVHIDDVCGMMIHAIENETMCGPYNVSAPSPIPMKILMKEILTVIQSKAVLLPIPAPLIRLGAGQMSHMLLSSQLCSTDKLLKTSYQFRFPDIAMALKDLLK